MPSLTWCNPIIDAPSADPFIFRASDAYWLVATGRASDGRFLPMWRSVNLVDWEFVRGAVKRGDSRSWNRYNFWAPEVLTYQGRYWLYYTAKNVRDDENHSNRVGLAVSEKPEGPYEDVGVVVDHSSLDGSPFLDTDGQLWLYYVTDHGSLRGHAPGKIWVDRLLTPDKIADDPVCLVDRHGWQEGPVAFTQPDGRVRLTFSVGAWTNDTYRVAQAVGDRPHGPFEESDSIIMSSSDSVKGPGHHNFFTGPDGQRWIVYHGWDPGMTNRYARIDGVSCEPDGTIRRLAPSTVQQAHSW
ncbi:MAG: family 43 glycosylhydrolase [Chitinivibrionales bacterium]|nr:family 43 glycosylhydrolase [Chitinivibrionales bacterium]